MNTLDRARGILIGLACGDGLGRPVEFRSAHQIRRRYGKLTEMRGDGTHNQPAGTVSDDTELTLCIARSLFENNGFDGRDIAGRFVDWLESDPFDVGQMTESALLEIREGASWEEAGTRVWQDAPEGQNAGNGSLMRTAPHAIAFAGADTDHLVEVSKQSSAITHADPRCTYACAVLNLTLAGYLQTEETNHPLNEALDVVREEAPDELMESLRDVPDGVYSPGLETSGYVLHTLRTAMHDALTEPTAEDAIVTAVNRGGDTDTIGAVTGAIAGARHGAEALPDRWQSKIDETEQLRHLADALLNIEIA